MIHLLHWTTGDPLSVESAALFNINSVSLYLVSATCFWENKTVAEREGQTEPHWATAASSKFKNCQFKRD